MGVQEGLLGAHVVVDDRDEAPERMWLCSQQLGCLGHDIGVCIWARLSQGLWHSKLLLVPVASA